MIRLRPALIAGCLLLAVAPLPALSSPTPPPAPAPAGTPLVPAGYQALTGPLHEHSGYSDGYPDSTPETYYSSAARLGNDFLMSGEHSDTLDVPFVASDECLGAAVVKCPGGDPDPAKALRKWDAMQTYADAATTDTFTGIRGFEWTSDRFDHIDVYFSRRFTGAKADGGYADMATFYRWLTTRSELGGGGDGLATFNHPGAKKLQGVGDSDPQRAWNDFAYEPTADRQMVGLEVYNDDQEYGSRGPGAGYYVRALDKGWHVGAIGAEDLGHGRGDDWGGPSWAKTVILSTDRSAAALRSAMQARRFYAVRTAATQLGFTVDGAVMGSRLNRTPGAPLTLAASAVTAGRSGLSLEVVTSGGRVVATATDNLNITVPAATSDRYYFLRVKDGAAVVGYSSPVWVQQSRPAAVGEWLAGDLHVHTCYSHDTYCARGQKGSYFQEPTNGPLDAVLGPVGEVLPADTLDELGLGDSNTDAKDVYTLGSTVSERFAEAAVKGLDYLAITDHSSNSNPDEDGSVSVHDPGFGTSGVVGVPGYENSIGGHAQMLGATHLFDPGTKSAADINTMADQLRAEGGLLQANHPADQADQRPTCANASGLNWSYGYDVKVESVEVWNVGHFLQPPAPASQTNDDAITLWECMLSKGWKVAPTGGSDSHWKTTVAAQGIGNPTTWVFADERSSQGVLDGIKAGRTAISFQTPVSGATLLMLEGDVDRDGVFEAMIGDTVPPGTPLRVRASGTPGAGRVHIRANGRTIVDGAALAPGGSVAFTLTEPGWVWAQLVAEETRAPRLAACEPFLGAKTTYCRNQLNVLAMTGAVYVADPPPPPPPTDSCPAGYSPKPQSPAGPREDKCKKD